jgi:hypothetical protein
MQYFKTDEYGNIIQIVKSDQGINDNTFIEYEGDLSKHWYNISTQTVVQYTDLQQTTKRNYKIGATHWSNVTMEWIIPDALNNAKVLASSKITYARSLATLSSFTYDGKEIATDDLSRSDIDGVSNYVALFGTLPPNFPNVWKAMDNTYVSIPDVATWKLFITAMVAKGTTNFLNSETKKSSIASALTVEEVEAIQW